MAPRKDPASAVVDFFASAPVETAATVLAICKSIVAKRQPPKAKRTKGPRAAVSGSGTSAASETVNRV